MKFKNKVNYYNFFFVLFFILAGLYLIKTRNPDTDVYFLAATGRNIWENKCIPEFNPFYIHSDYKIIVQQWLCCLINYFLFQYFGNIGIYIFAVLSAILFNYIIYMLFRNFLSQKIHLFISLIFCNIVMLNFYTTRPSLLSACIIFSQILNFVLYQKENKKKYLLYNILLSLLLINWHQSMWPISLIFSAAFILPNKNKTFKEYITDQKYLIYTIFFMFLIGIFNPNFISGMFYLLKSANVLDSPIAEMAGITFISTYGLLSLITFGFILNHIIQSIHRKDINYQILFLEIISFILGICYLRNIWFTLLGFIFAFTFVFKNMKDFNLFKNATRFQTICIICLNIILIIANITNSYNFNITQDNLLSPYSAVQYLDTCQENIILYTDFNNGSFMEWNNYKVYIDARSEIAQKEINERFDLFSEYVNVYKGTIHYKTFLEKYNFTHILVIKNTPFYYYLNSNPDYKSILNNKNLDYELYEIRS